MLGLGLGVNFAWDNNNNNYDSNDNNSNDDNNNDKNPLLKFLKKQS